MGKVENIESNSSPNLFNTPLEVGLRGVVILDQLNEWADLEKIMYLDYLSLNTKDIGGEESIHAPIPNRGVQVFARKDLLQKGLVIYLAKELINVNATDEGFLYSINNVGKKFLEYFESDYYQLLVSRVKWVVSQFGTKTNSQIREFIKENLQEWGGEYLGADNLGKQ
ncbi:MAG TPA: ABC-three component system middle component 2 [Flavisolibacter sp.]|nr:ABC-three component system middle component 2 [Flavisolibacter sp.]